MRRIWLPQLFGSLMLIWALNPDNPYAYYVLLRWVCCSILIFLAFQIYKQGKEGWVWVIGVIAAIYNPIIPVHLNREIWSIINIVTIIILLISIFIIKPEGNVDEIEND